MLTEAIIVGIVFAGIAIAPALFRYIRDNRDDDTPGTPAPAPRPPKPVPQNVWERGELVQSGPGELPEVFHHLPRCGTECSENDSADMCSVIERDEWSVHRTTCKKLQLFGS